MNPMNDENKQPIQNGLYAICRLADVNISRACTSIPLDCEPILPSDSTNIELTPSILTRNNFHMHRINPNYMNTLLSISVE